MKGECRYKGWFSIVQFCPDANRLESANIGVLLFCPALDFLDVRTASDNQRIIKFFGLDFDFDLVNSFRQGLKERLCKERKSIADLDQLLDFIDKRANQIRLSPPRSIRVTSPEKQLNELFVELVGESGQRQTIKMDKREMNRSAEDQRRFIEHLEHATQIVRSWPRWKQTVLGENSEPKDTHS